MDCGDGCQDILLAPLQFFDVSADRVDQWMNARLEELPTECRPNKVVSLGIRLQECLNLVGAQMNIIVLYDDAGDVEPVVQ